MRIIGLIILTLTLNSCLKSIESAHSDNKEDFKTKKEDFIAIVDYLETLTLDDKGKDIEIPMEKILTKEQEKIKDLGIKTIRYTDIDCEKSKREYSFDIGEGWNVKTLRVVQFYFNPCDPSGTNLHEYDGHHRDTWGLGDGWIMYTDTDFI